MIEMRGRLRFPMVLLFCAGVVAAQSFGVVPAFGADLARTHKWTSLGPEGGWISALVIDPQHPATIYAGTRHNGVFKTLDEGESWIRASDGLPGAWVYTLAMDPQNTQTLYASVWPGGLFKTTDGAATWTFAGSNLPDFAGILVVDPQHPSTVYAAPGGITFMSGGFFGVYKTTDGGAKWTATNFGVPDDRLWVFSLAIDPRNPNTLYASGSVYTENYSGSTSLLFKTTNGGATWRADASAPPLSMMVVDPQDSSRLFGLADNDPARAGSAGGVWRSTDAGTTWVVAANSGLAEFRRPLGLAIDPQNTDTLYTVIGCCGGPGALFKSADAGEHWTEISSGLAGANFNPMDDCSCNSTNVGLAVHPFSSNSVYVGTNGDGVFKTVDKGATWKASNSGLEAIGAVRVAIDPRSPAVIYALSPNRIYRSMNSGSTWTAGWGVPAVKLSGAFAQAPQSPDQLYAGSFGFEEGGGGRILKSEDGGASWHDANSKVSFDGVYSVAVDPFDSLTVYAGTGAGVYKTTDGGANWLLVTATDISGSYALAVDPTDSSTLYAGAWTRASLYKSVDGGASWTAASTGLPTREPSSYNWVSSLAIDPKDSHIVYAGLTEEPAGIFKSLDGGGTWNRSSSGLASKIRSVTSLAINPQNTDLLYAATDRGLFRSLDGGTSWIEVSSGTTVSVAVDERGRNRVYTAGSEGVLRIDFLPEVTHAMKTRSGGAK